MELLVKQSKLKYNYEYQVYQDDELIYIGKVKRNLIPQFRDIRLFDIDSNEKARLLQEDFFRYVLGLIPVVNWFKASVCPFNLYQSNTKIGYIKENYNGDEYVLGRIKDDKYELYEHSGNNISIFCNELQVGLIKRNAWKEWDGDTYSVLINRTFNKEFAILFTLLSDVLWSTSDTSIVSVSWNTKIQLTGRSLDSDWKPED